MKKPDEPLEPAAASRPAPSHRPASDPQRSTKPAEIGGPKGPEPTRYGDWEVGGRVSDF